MAKEKDDYSLEEYLNLKRENIFVSLFFLILLISILMIDACCVSNAVDSLNSTG